LIHSEDTLLTADRWETAVDDISTGDNIWKKVYHSRIFSVGIKTVTLKSMIKWEKMKKKLIFNKRGISFQINIHISAETNVLHLLYIDKIVQ